LRRTHQELWNLPAIPTESPVSKVLGAVVNDWQVSGVFTGGSGAPYDVAYSYQTAGANVNLTGSPSYRARIRTVGDIGSGCSSDRQTPPGPGWCSHCTRRCC
jgi:hypothetical protein